MNLVKYFETGDWRLNYAMTTSTPKDPKSKTLKKFTPID